MKIRQWIYTTSCWNIRRQSGWNTFSYSRSLSDEEVDELERKCQLQGNLDESCFPVYFVLTLNSGRKVICQSVSLGCSFYDGRPGATLTHALIIDADEDWPQLPICYAGADVFWKDLPDDVKRQALYYMEHPSEWRQPPYLPDMTERDLEASGFYSLAAIERNLRQEDFAAKTSRLIRELLLMREDQFPLRFKCQPGRSALFLAALCYLLPGMTQGKSLSSLSRTDSGVSLYNFFAIVGTRDDNAHVDISNADSGIHPIVDAARRDLGLWYEFASEWGRMATGRMDGAVQIFKILQGKGEEESLTEAQTDALLDLPPELPMPLMIRIGAALSHYPRLTSTGNGFARLASSFMDAFNRIFSSCAPEEKIQWRTLMKNIMGRAAALAAAREVPVADMLDLFARNKGYIPLWLSEKQLEQALASCAGPDGFIPLLCLTSRLSELMGEDSPDWRNFHCVQRALGILADSPELWQQLMAACGDHMEACSFFVSVLQCHARAAKSLEAVMEEYYSTLSESQRDEICCCLLKHRATEAAVSECMARLRPHPTWAGVMELERLFRRYPDFAAPMIEAALPLLSETAYASREGEWLLQQLQNTTQPKLRQALADRLLSAFPLEEPDQATLIFAGKLARCLQAFPIDKKRLSLPSFFHAITPLDSMEPDEMVPYLEKRISPYFSKGSPSKLSDSAIDRIRPWFYSRLLECAPLSEVHFYMLENKWGWGQAAYIAACKTAAGKFASGNRIPMQNPCCFALLQTLSSVNDLDLVRCVLEVCAPALFSRIDKKSLERFRLRFAPPAPGTRPDNWRLIEHYLDENRRSCFSRLFSRFLGKKQPYT